MGLIVLSLTQLIVVLDGTIVTIALPDAQQDLGLTDGQRQWVVTAYALAFGALLLIGGRVADYWGRKKAFIVGLVGFGLASFLGGIAPNGADLILARALQGLFAALLAPSSLALLTVSFPSGRERNTAFAVFGSVAGAGSALGLVLGGLLTELANWRWCLFVNIFFVAAGIIGGIFFITGSKTEGKSRYDLWGVITVTLGLGALVYGFTLAEKGWTRLDTLGFLALGIGFLVMFVWVQTRATSPLLPLRIIRHRVRGSAFFIQAVAGSVAIGGTVFMSYHLQVVLMMSPLQAGLASLPFTLSTLSAAPLATKALQRYGPRPLLVTGPLIVALGLLHLSGITATGTYLQQVLPGFIIIGIGMAAVYVPLQNLALAGVAAQDSGVAGAASTSMMQIGGSVGLSVFTAVAAASYGTVLLADGALAPASLTQGYSAAFIAAAAGMALAGAVAAAFLRGRDGNPGNPKTEQKEAMEVG
ncbi:MFS transporter [Paenarthrobacter sp. YIM B13468]|uniref:MFS transporter n=1 Tax=Paenarthrobacter sp. YIM B13468 TaxID=3366295 RepID=UPI00366E6391